MRTLGHFLAYLALGLWLGALILFGAVLAPLAFNRLPPLFPNQAQGFQAAGIIVGGALTRLHWMGLICGVVFLLVMLVSRPHFRSIIPQFVLVVAMLVITAYSQFSVIPRMDTAQASVGGNIEAVSPNNPGREIFDRLHHVSVDLEIAVLVCGVLALAATAHLARYPQPQLPPPRVRPVEPPEAVKPRP